MKYKYKAVTDAGKYVNGEIEAVDMRVAASMVREQKMTPISVTQKNETFDLSDLPSGVYRLQILNSYRSIIYNKNIVKQ